MTRCVIGEREHEAHHGYLCDNHLQKLSGMLRDIEDEALILSTRPSMAVGYDRSGGTLASQQAPIRLTPAALRDRRHGTGATLLTEFDELAWDDTPSALETLHSRARTVREEREMNEPTTTVYLGRDVRPTGMHGPVCDRYCWHDSCGPWITDTVRALATLTGERDFLSRQLVWICEQPWADEFYAEINDLLHALRRANNTIEVAVGTCESLQPDGKMCDGDVWHVLVKPDGRIERGHHGAAHPDDEPGFRCGACRRVWTGTEAVRKRDALWRAELARKEAG